MFRQSSSARHKLFVISGPSGSGKGTLIKSLFSERKDVALSVSATTRKIRAGEEEGKDYYFLAQEEFDRFVKANQFLELARVHGYYYGTLKEEVHKKFKAGYNVILEIDPQGAMQVKQKKPDAVLIFIQPPSLEVLARRLRARGTEKEEIIKQRLEDAKGELEQAKNYDYVIINDTIDRASQELNEVIRKEIEND